MKSIVILSPPLVSSPILFHQQLVFPPYASLRLGAYLQAQGNNVRVMNCLEPPVTSSAIPESLGYKDPFRARLRYYGTTPETLRRDLADQGDPDEIWISGVITYCWRVFHHVIEICRDVHPRARIRFGGIYPTLCPEKARTSLADDVFEGELTEADAYLPDYGLLRHPSRYTFVVNSTKGCPNRCSYCAIGLLEKKFRFYEPVRIADLIQENCDRHGFKEVLFFDNNILVHAREHFETILDELVRRNVPVSIPRLEHGFQPDLVYPQILDKLIYLGFERMSLPLESTHQTERDQFHRPDDLAHIHRAIDIGLERGVTVMLKILCGMPGQTLESIMDAVSFAYRYGCLPDLQPFTPVPRTEEYERCLALKGELDLEDLEPLGWYFAHDRMRKEDLDTLMRDVSQTPHARFARSPSSTGISLRSGAILPPRESVAFFAMPKYANVSHEVIDHDNRRYLADFCDVDEIPQFVSAEQTIAHLSRLRTAWLFLNGGFDPYDLVAQRNERGAQVGFILYPYVIEPWRRRIARLVRLLTPRDIIIAFSNYVVQTLQETGTAADIVKMPIPVDCQQFSPSYRHQGVRAIYCGRLSPDKGLLEALQAVEDIETITAMHIVCPMSGLSRDEEQYLARVKQSAAKAALRQRVVFHGPLVQDQEEKRRLMSDCDLLLHLTTSRDETFGRVIVEGFAAGLAVVTTDWRGVRELVQDGENGFLINPQSPDIVSEARVAIRRLLPPDRLMKMRRENRRKSLQFDYRPTVFSLSRRLAAPRPATSVASHHGATCEHAICVRDTDDLGSLSSGRFVRVYFGNDFCELQIPSPAELKEVRALLEKTRCSLTLVLPWCTDAGIGKLDHILPMLPSDTEVVFNDWGVLEILRQTKLVPVMGRLLVSNTKDPRLGADPNVSKFCNLDDTAFQEFLVARRVRRVELDNVLQGYRFALIPELRASLHYPFVNITVTRKCPFAPSQMTDVCNYACADDDAWGSLDGYNGPLIIKGNGQFYRNNHHPDDLLYRGIDRIVYTPRLPFAKPRFRKRE